MSRAPSRDNNIATREGILYFSGLSFTTELLEFKKVRNIKR